MSAWRPVMAKPRRLPTRSAHGCTSQASISSTPAAALADQMVMVEGVAEPVQRLTAVPPEDIDLAAVDQALERPVYGRKADPPAQLRVEVLGGEGLGGLAQGRKHGAALPGGPRLEGDGC